jgi:hypothetical protein
MNNKQLIDEYLLILGLTIIETVSPERNINQEI